jgi:hypothetical protein
MIEPTRECKRCGVSVRITPSGHLRAHPCPHGRGCVLSYVARRRGDRPKRCNVCDARTQLPLFQVEG